ncbi:MAG TPA: SDR family oxidoreductase [Acidimicrobiales bacterium]|nr:SDR family oxidoreductase [Acidimicrobiales bacterium]
MTSSATGSRLQDKIAVLFGAGGEVGAQVADEFARQGARLFLSGRTLDHVHAVADAIPDGKAVTDVAGLDALDEEAVNAYLERVVAAEGRIDVVFNAMGPQANEYGNATPTMDLPVEKFMLPMNTMVASQFITARAASRHMAGRGSGVVVFLSGTPSRGTANTSAIGAAFGALESLTRSLAVELGPHGVRVVCVRTMGMAETRIMQQTYELGGKAMGVPKEKIEEIVTSRAVLGRSPTLDDTATLISFLASDEARAITGAIVNSSCGQVLD